MNENRTKNIVLAAMFAALIFLGTFVFRIPIAAANGYIHFGDGFIYIAAALLPPPLAAAAGAVGGLLSDVLAGYAVYAPWTAVIKALMGALVALMLRNNAFMLRLSGQKPEGASPAAGLRRAVLAVLLAGLVNIAGYFLADGLLYSFPAALLALPMNGLQSLFGVAVFFALAPAFSRALRASSGKRD